jgi:hypothetical protein
LDKAVLGVEMALLRTEIEKALEELISQEEGMRFQGLAVVIGKLRWPELVARQRKKDLGLDAYARASLTQENVGKGLAASITPTLTKISHDVVTAKENFPDLRKLIFVTPAKVGNADRKKWEDKIEQDHGIELHVIEREEIITLMQMPESASLLASFLYLKHDIEPPAESVVAKAKRAAEVVVQNWFSKTKNQPLIDLLAVRLDHDGAESDDLLSLEQIDQALSQSRRIVLEGPAGRGKTTTLIQLGLKSRFAGIPLMIELPAWASSGREILEYVAGMPAFQAEGLTSADLAQLQTVEPFLFLLNGWNEIAESNSVRAVEALKLLERDFPSSGIIVATRKHHFTPPLPGATQLRLLRLRHSERTSYLEARLGGKGRALRIRIDSEPALDDLTLTPFVLSEVASLFEAGADIPSTKIGILSEVLRLQEQRDEHRNALLTAPIFGRQTDFLKTLATEMTRRGTVYLGEAEARSFTADITNELVACGQLSPAGSPEVLSLLTAHHVLERIDYPKIAFQFEHQQVQEYYAALDLFERLLDIGEGDQEAIERFKEQYVNDPVWGEPVRMIAEMCAESTEDEALHDRAVSAGVKLVGMTLSVDIVFAGELARLCGKLIWKKVRDSVGERLRNVYTVQEGAFRQLALAAMLGTGSDDFKDIIIPVLSGSDQQSRLKTYRLFPSIETSSLGPNWRDEVRGWSEEARSDFVAELLHHRLKVEIANFAAEDESKVVKSAAISGLLWTGSEEVLARVLESLDPETFEELACQHTNEFPKDLRPKQIIAIRHRLDATQDPSSRLRMGLELIELGERRLAEIIKDAMTALSGSELSKIGSPTVKHALEYIGRTDPEWESDWVAIRIAEGSLWDPKYWLPFVTCVSDDLTDKLLTRLETEDLRKERIDGLIFAVSKLSNENISARVFSKLRELQGRVDEDHDKKHEFESQIIWQLEALFRSFPGDVAAAGILSSASCRDPLDIKVTTQVLTRIASDMEPLKICNDDLRVQLRYYLRSTIDIVLEQDDFNGKEKADMASSIARIGEPGDIELLVRLIYADIERIRQGKAARASGDSGPRVNGSYMSYSRWHIASARLLDSCGANEVLIDLLSEPEYRSDAAAAMAVDFLPKSSQFFSRPFRSDIMWAAREGRSTSPADDQWRTRFASAINSEIERLRERAPEGKSFPILAQLANALAAVDGHGSAATVLEIIGKPDEWNQFICLDAAERLLIAGVLLPVNTLFSQVNPILERTRHWLQKSERDLLRRALVLCPFVDDPKLGIAKMREVLSKRQFRGYELRELIMALGESRSEAASELLYDLATDPQIFRECDDYLIDALSKLNKPLARELLLGLVDPEIPDLLLTRRPQREDVLVGRLAELAQDDAEVGERLRKLCESDIPILIRDILSKVMNLIGTPEAFSASLSLIDDTRQIAIPQGIWSLLNNAFINRRPHAQNSSIFELSPSSSNQLRTELFRMAIRDEKRWKSALRLLVEIEEWRLEQGRPTIEPRHPDLTSGQPWPPWEAFGHPNQKTLDGHL